MMKTAGGKKTTRVGKIVAIVLIALGVLAGFYALHRNQNRLSTDDASIEGDLVHVAATVGGRIVEIAVKEGDKTRKGELLFQIDPVPYRLAVAQAEADLALARAALETKRRLVGNQKAAALIADEQVNRAMQNYELTVRTVKRLKPLATKGYVPVQQLDQAEVAKRDAATSLAQAKEQKAAADQAVDTVDSAEATVQARIVALEIARHALNETTVKAPISGRVVGLSVLPGEIIAPLQSLFLLISEDEWFVVASFRETDLSSIKVGDCATVYSMIDRHQPIRGAVESIGSGILDTDRVSLPRSLPYVGPSLNWVRVAKRFPVRIRLHEPPQDLMRVGASAVVEVKNDSSCP